MRGQILLGLAASLIMLISATTCRADTITTYTNPTAFANVVNQGTALIDNFTGFNSGQVFGSYTQHNSYFGYTATGSTLLFGSSNFTPPLMEDNYANTTLTLTVNNSLATSPVNVTAFGGYFYETGPSENFLAHPVSLTIHYGVSSSMTFTFTLTSIANSYFGFTDTNITSGAYITSIVENYPTYTGDFDAVSGLTEGSAMPSVVPEPASIVLCGLAGAIGLVVNRPRRNRRIKGSN